MKKLGSILLALALALGCMSMTVGAADFLAHYPVQFNNDTVAKVTYLTSNGSVNESFEKEIQAAFSSYEAGTLTLGTPLSVVGIELQPEVTTLLLNADLT
ncbi:MAG: hypothetical protein RRY21_03710, partial [Oscillospiraceae bacterium]